MEHYREREEDWRDTWNDEGRRPQEDGGEHEEGLSLVINFSYIFV